MLHEHNPAVLRLYKIKYLIDLFGRVTESVFHNLARNMALLVRKQYHSTGLNVRAFERFHSPGKSIMENRKANHPAFIMIGHVSSLVLGART